MQPRTQMRSPYMEFAKLRSGARYNLATSGIMSYPLAELPVGITDLEINGPAIYGYAPLQERLARYNGVSAECVFAAAGTSMANHMAMAACFNPGDEVLIEHPTYGQMNHASVKAPLRELIEPPHGVKILTKTGRLEFWVYAP